MMARLQCHTARHTWLNTSADTEIVGSIPGQKLQLQDKKNSRGFLQTSIDFVKNKTENQERKKTV